MHPDLSVVPEDPQGALLHSALQKVLTPPSLPEGFRATVMTEVLADRLAELESRRLALELEHAKALAQMRFGQVRIRRDTLALIAVAAFTAGSCAHLALPWLRANTGMDSAAIAPVLALAIGAVSGLSVWVERIGGWRALLGMRQH